MKKMLAWIVVGLFVAVAFGGVFVVPVVYGGWWGLASVLTGLALSALVVWAVYEVGR